MNFLKGLAAGAAAYAVYRGVEAAFDRVMGPDPTTEGRGETLEKIEKDAVVLVGSRMDHIPDSDQRDNIVKALNIGASILATAAASEIREQFFSEDTPDMVDTIIGATISFIILDELLKPAMGLQARPSSFGGHARRFVTHLASRTANGAMRQALAS